MDIISKPEYVEQPRIDLVCGFPYGEQGITIDPEKDEIAEKDDRIIVTAGPDREEITFYKRHLCYTRVKHYVQKFRKDPKTGAAINPIVAAVERAAEGGRKGPTDPNIPLVR